MTEKKISPRQFMDAVGAHGWRTVGEGGCAFYRTHSLKESARLVSAISELPGIEDHSPTLDIRQDGVTVRLITYTDHYFGMSQRDVEVARQISAAAHGLGLSADPSAIQSVSIIPGAPDIAHVMPFWRAVLDYEPRRDSPKEDLVDPRDRGPAFWFEQMEKPRTDGGGSIHVVVWVPHEQARARLDAALAAGGRMVRDAHAPSWWTLADPAGNEVDIASTSSLS
jgi:4a-hydroxytetrahydrobiopterin dehydratase